MKPTFRVPRTWWLCLFIPVMVTAFGTNASAEPNWEGSISAQTAEVGVPVLVEPVWTPEPPALTAEQIAKLEYWQGRTSLPGPIAERVGEDLGAPAPKPGTESVVVDQTNAPGDATLFRNIDFGSKIPSGFKSNVMESSVGTAGKWVFFTGNWFAARTIKGGGKKLDQWQHIDPFADFPDFCCDQIAIYDESRNRYFWLRMGIPDANGENVFKLSVSKNAMKKFWTYTTAPTDLDPTWTNQWWDYPHIQLGADFLYMAWNMFNQSGFFTRTVVLRWPLDALAAGTAFSYLYLPIEDWATVVPVQGAWHRMYWASNWPLSVPQNSRIRIWRWDEDSNTIFWVTRDVTPWTFTSRGDAVCGSSTGNWAARYDQRVLTGARYTIYNDGIQDPRIPGRKILAWWWNVGQGGSFPHPYIDAAAFYEDTLNQVGGWLGRPYIWSPDFCFAYPSATPNKRQDLGMVFHYGAEAEGYNPDIGYSIADDYVWAPPGWVIYKVRQSNARPSDNVWGDYNTVREYEPTQKVWVAGSHYIPGRIDCERCSEPIYFIFGRDRDRQSWKRWDRK